ncbi:MAG: helix-turn-helix domain-containing protein [Bacilli bacterium]|nr:helix-turn-helix domain-containing protein [Bacilli bacterium]
MENNNNIIYSVNDVMEILQLARTTILNFIKKGELKAAYLGNQYRIRKEDLDSFIEAKSK